MRIIEETRGLIHAASRVPLSPAVTLAPSSPDPDHGLIETRVELTSRGDRVPWTLWQPQKNANNRLVVLQFGLGEHIDSRHRATVRQLIDRGFSVATLDWPLHGTRHSPKLSARLLKAIDATEDDPNGAGLVRYLVQQSALDLGRALDWTAAQTPLSTDRIALWGPVEATPLIALFAALDPRASVLALHGDPSAEGGRLPDAFELLARSTLDAMLWLAPNPTAPSSKAWSKALRRICPGDVYTEAQEESPAEPLERASANRVCEFVNKNLA
ncbi:MAG: hypothetical protein CBC48_11385 [bacterium TMED88]|nr:hypothetical protein [Deltaproteobacteria bacterium]OUV29945.1 MAG: hypothetical protein CBC48_11385 [bacterium TMED88]